MAYDDNKNLALVHPPSQVCRQWRDAALETVERLSPASLERTPRQRALLRRFSSVVHLSLRQCSLPPSAEALGACLVDLPHLQVLALHPLMIVPPTTFSRWGWPAGG